MEKFRAKFHLRSFAVGSLSFENKSFARKSKQTEGKKMKWGKKVKGAEKKQFGQPGEAEASSWDYNFFSGNLFEGIRTMPVAFLN